jgi:uncharacterized cysteine cluster protein YcgN (CxxCxxCC family)
MSILTENQIRGRARTQTINLSRGGYTKSASTILLEAKASQEAKREFDIFLSHSVLDAEIVLGTRLTLEDYGYSVYVDWLDDPQLDRKKVNSTTANQLRVRMNESRCLFYLTTQNSSQSRWMPWECGYMDAKKDKVAIFPVLTYSSESFFGVEYLGLYPYVSEDTQRYSQLKKIYINEDKNTYCLFDDWLTGSKPTKQT